MLMVLALAGPDAVEDYEMVCALNNKYICPLEFLEDRGHQEYMRETWICRIS